MQLPAEKLFYLGVKALIQNEHDLVLLLRVTRSDGTRYWDLPGGRINPGEDPETTLRREILEETGIRELKITKHLGMTLTAIEIPINDEAKGGLILSVYACESPELTNVTPEENVEIVWSSGEEALERLSVKLEPLLPALRSALS